MSLLLFRIRLSGCALEELRRKRFSTFLPSNSIESLKLRLTVGSVQVLHADLSL